MMKFFKVRPSHATLIVTSTVAQKSRSSRATARQPCSQGDSQAIRTVHLKANPELAVPVYD